MRRTVVVLVLLGALGAVEASAAGSGFDPRIVTFGAQREEIKSRPIEQRPNRPLHVYGNSVRRRASRPGR